MNNLLKNVVNSSLILGMVLFSVGCGDNGCCDKSKIVANVNLLGANNLLSDNTLPSGNTLTVDGLGSSTDSNITQAVWTVYADDSKDTVLTTKKVTNETTNVSLILGEPGKHKVCVVVTDTNKLTAEDCKTIIVPENTEPVFPTATITGLPAEMKTGCPIPAVSGANSTTSSGSGLLTYAWTLDDTGAGEEATPTLPTSFTDTPSPHRLCLTVTDSNQIEGEEVCQTVTMISHVPPTAILDVKNSADELVTALDKGITYNLSCENSYDDCNETDDINSCEFHGRSYLVADGEDCNYDNKIADYITDCGINQTTGDLIASIGTCAAQTPSKYNCVDLTLMVTDKNGLETNTTKSFPINLP